MVPDGEFHQVLFSIRYRILNSILGNGTLPEAGGSVCCEFIAGTCERRVWSGERIAQIVFAGCNLRFERPEN